MGLSKLIGFHPAFIGLLIRAGHSKPERIQPSKQTKNVPTTFVAKEEEQDLHGTSATICCVIQA